MGRTVSVKSRGCAPDCTVYFFPEQEKLKGVLKVRKRSLSPVYLF